MFFIVYDCKKRWKNMKDTYNKRKRISKLSTGSSTKKKPSKWLLSNVLSFIDLIPEQEYVIYKYIIFN